MPAAVEIAEALIGLFPTEDAVAAIGGDEPPARSEQFEDLVWPDFEVAMIGAGSAEFRTERRGLDGLLEGWSDWLEPFESHRTEVEGVRDAGDCAVVFVRQVARPKGTAAEVENLGAAVLWAREGKLSRIEFHLDRGLALRAAGLES